MKNAFGVKLFIDSRKRKNFELKGVGKCFDDSDAESPIGKWLYFTDLLMNLIFSFSQTSIKSIEIQYQFSLSFSVEWSNENLMIFIVLIGCFWPIFQDQCYGMLFFRTVIETNFSNSTSHFEQKDTMTFESLETDQDKETTEDRLSFVKKRETSTDKNALSSCVSMNRRIYWSRTKRCRFSFWLKI